MKTSLQKQIYTHEYENHHSEPDIYLLNIGIEIKWTYETLFETFFLNEYMTKKLRLMIIQKTAPPPPPPPQKKKKKKKKEKKEIL